MKNYFLLFSFSTITIFNSFSQTENFVHCYGNDTVLIKKISEYISGDTVVKTFHDYTFDFNGQVNTDFNYYHFNDSIFSKFDGNYYIIGDNNPQVGDIWHPLRYYIYSYTDTTESCSHFMNLKVESIEQLLIEGNLTNYIHLKDLNADNGQEFDYSFIAGAGVTQGGPLYNLSVSMPFCDMIAEIPEVSFKSYTLNNSTYLENICEIIDDSGISENMSNEPLIYTTENYITVENIEHITELSIIELTGKVVLLTKGERLFYNHLNGIYFIKVIYDKGQFIKRVYLD